MLLNLKPGKGRTAYEAWAKGTDLPTVKALRSIEHFAVLEATGLLGSEDKPPYDYIEVLDVIDMDIFGTESASDTMHQVAAEFQEWADPIFIVTRDITVATQAP